MLHFLVPRTRIFQVLLIQCFNNSTANFAPSNRKRAVTTVDKVPEPANWRAPVTPDPPVVDLDHIRRRHLALPCCPGLPLAVLAGTESSEASHPTQD